MEVESGLVDRPEQRLPHPDRDWVPSNGRTPGRSVRATGRTVVGARRGGRRRGLGRRGIVDDRSHRSGAGVTGSSAPTPEVAVRETGRPSKDVCVRPQAHLTPGPWYPTKEDTKYIVCERPGRDGDVTRRPVVSPMILPQSLSGLRIYGVRSALSLFVCLPVFTMVFCLHNNHRSLLPTSSVFFCLPLKSRATPHS